MPRIHATNTAGTYAAKIFFLLLNTLLMFKRISTFYLEQRRGVYQTSHQAEFSEPRGFAASRRPRHG